MPSGQNIAGHLGVGMADVRGIVDVEDGRSYVKVLDTVDILGFSLQCMLIDGSLRGPEFISEFCAGLLKAHP